MGHKVHPNGFRLGVYRGWEANWYAASKDYTKLLHEDLEMRRLIMGRLRNAGIARVETERSSNAQMTVTIHTAKPGIVIGKGGASVDQLREDLEKRFGNRVRISIQEIKQPELDAQLVAENIASQIERRISHRRAMKQAIMRTMRAGARGVRVGLAGRLRGAEMARREKDREGRVPLHTLRADIQFGRATAKTTFGVIGVKVWLYKGDVATRRELREAASQQEAAPRAAQPSGAPPAPGEHPSRPADGRGDRGGPGGQGPRRRRGGRRGTGSGAGPAGRGPAPQGREQSRPAGGPGADRERAPRSAGPTKPPAEGRPAGDRRAETPKEGGDAPA